MFERLDHIAVEVADFDHWLERLSRCSLRVVRNGTRYQTGQRIALLGDGTGMKIELIEAPDQPPTMAHVAFRVTDTDSAYATMLENGWQPKHPPHDLPAAQARTALLTHQGGVNVQIITYAPDSPDVAEWPVTPADQPLSDKEGT